MLSVAKKPDLPYPASPEWKVKVREELDRRGRGAFTKLAKEIGCKTSQLADLLGEQKTSPLVAKINRSFGWAPPIPPSTTRDSGELQYIYDRLSAEQRKLLLEAAEIVRSPDPIQREALAAIVHALRKPPSNDEGKR